ncbi:MAG: cache domain-containing protein, partial [Desulfobulbaceae bacterium]|nr:cache domain-containing protein [Desulfobulbaceae bacterium]
MYLIIAMTLFMFIVNAQFAWMNINRIKEIGLGKIADVIADSQRKQLKTSVDTLAVVLATALKPVTSPHDQEQLLWDMVKDIRFEEDRSGYYFVFKDTVNIVTGSNPEQRGQELGQLKDPNGVVVVEELFQLAKKGGG